jgi:DNA repair photolyase
MTPINPSGLWKKRLGDWVINPYVGCEHGCFHCYCPAMPGVKFNNNGHTQDEWGKYLIPKSGIIEALQTQLKRFTPDKARTTEWGDGWILMSFLTDCYTPAEAKLKLTRNCLQLLLEAGHRVRLQTRSSLVERDFDLLEAHRDQVLLGTSLPYLDDKLARVLEPRATAPTRRLKMLQKARRRGIQVYVAVAPFLPFHDGETMEAVLREVEPLDPREIFCEVLNPKGDNISMMCRALDRAYPGQAERMRSYTPESWAQFTWKVLSLGMKRNDRFIPWPDTQRFWKTHLNADQTAFLDAYLPPPSAGEPAIA